jgi:hypothetical protein
MRSAYCALRPAPDLDIGTNKEQSYGSCERGESLVEDSRGGRKRQDCGPARNGSMTQVFDSGCRHAHRLLPMGASYSADLG